MKDFKIYIGIASAFLLLYVVVLYNKPKPINWNSTLSSADKIPFGTYVLRQRLTDIFPEAKVANSNVSPYLFFRSQKQPGNLIIIAKAVEINKPDFEQMLRYIKAGNNVFITCFNWNGIIADTLKFDSGFEFDEDKTPLNFTNKHLKQRTYYKFPREMSANFFTKFDTVKATVLGTNKRGNATYLRYNFGKGSLLLCANPELFTNYSLLNTSGVEYAATALSYLPNNKNIFWDIYQNHDVMIDQSPLRVFFTNPSLQWAYYLSLGGLLLFVLFEIKRRQRIVPVIEPLKNATADFVKVVGQVYYEKRDNTNIAHKKILYLLSNLREQYQIKTNKLDDEFANVLSNKTGVDIALVTELVDQINYTANQHRITDRDLIKLNQLIENFYKAI